jgi:hypothetical protein
MRTNGSRQTLPEHAGFVAGSTSARQLTVRTVDAHEPAVGGEIQESTVGKVGSARSVLEGRGCGTAGRDGGQGRRSGEMGFHIFCPGPELGWTVGLMPVRVHALGVHPTLDDFRGSVIAIACEQTPDDLNAGRT